MTTGTYHPRGQALLALKKIKEPQGIYAAAAHNKRERWANTADRTAATQCLSGPRTAHAVADLAREKLAAEGIRKPRKDAVRAIEAVVTLQLSQPIDEIEFFAKSMTWLGRRFGGIANVLTADIHRDEAQLHMHVLILPIQQGRLNGSAMLGGRGQFRSHLEAFSLEVLPNFSLAPPLAVFCKWQRDEAARQVQNHLQINGHPLVGSNLWSTVLKFIHREPAPFMQALRLAPAS